MMTDAYAVWRAAEGKSVQKSVRTFWPELAAALDGHGGAGKRPAGGEPEQPDCQRRGQHCAGKAAGAMTGDGKYVCVPCWNGRAGFVRNPAWGAKRKSDGPSTQERWDNR
jgi:hypothetical protein